MKDNYVKFIKSTISLSNEKGSAVYSFEFFNNNMFPFSGFDSFASSYSLKLGRFKELIHLLNDTINIENVRDLTFKNIENQSRRLFTIRQLNELIKLKETINPVIFKSSSSLIFNQWNKIINKYNLDEKHKIDFTSKQNEAYSYLTEIADSLTEFFYISKDLLDRKNISPLEDEIFHQSLKKVKGVINLVENIDLINKSFLDITVNIVQYEKLKNKSFNLFNTMSTDFIEYNLKNKDISSSNNVIELLNKKNEETLDTKIKLSKSQKYEEAFLFINGQITFKDNKGNYIEPNSKKEALTIINDFYEDMISYELRKNPSLSKLIIQKFKEEKGYTSNNITSCLELVDLIKENNNILKNTKFNINIDSSIESIADKIYFEVKNFKLNQLINGIFGNKYKHLMSDENLPIFEKMFESSFTKSQLESFVSKKIASCQTQKEFSSHLKSIYDNLFTFGIEKLNADLAVSKNPVYIFNENGLHIIKIDNFEDSKLLGTSNWCISRSENTFNTYQKDNHQYFIYDFSKKEDDMNSLIGITLYPDGSVNAAHDKLDNNMIRNDYITDILEKIIVNDFDNLSLIHTNKKYTELLKMRDERIQPATKKSKNLTMELK